MEVGKRIREIRKLKKMTQKQLGEACGIAEPTIRRYELGHLNPKYSTLCKIADGLQVPVTDLIDPQDTKQMYVYMTKQLQHTQEYQDYLDVLKGTVNSLDTATEQKPSTQGYIDALKGALKVLDSPVKQNSNMLEHLKTVNGVVKSLNAAIEQERQESSLSPSKDTTEIQQDVTNEEKQINYEALISAIGENYGKESRRIRINAAFDNLNEQGQEIAVEIIDSLTLNPKYQKNKD